MAKSITHKEGYKKNPTQTTQVNAYDQWVYFVLLAIVVLLPITISLISLDRFDTPKLVIMRLATFLATVFWSLAIVRLKEREIRWTKLDFILLGFLALTVVSTILSINVGLSINGRYTRYEGLLTFLNYAGIYFLALQTFTSFGRIKALGQFLALVGGAVSIYGLLQ
ncbi:MAG: hypothetical protein QME63_09265, partial [Actinomycetota bacterium]|nr:hypothetical protein [Actinomycetota bacterium]